MGNAVSFDANPILALMRADVAVHELGHFAGFCLAAGAALPDSETLTVRRLDEGGYRALYPDGWTPEAVDDRLIGTACGPMAGWAFSESIVRTASSPPLEKSLARIREADGIELMILAMSDRSASDSDKRLMMIAGCLAGSEQKGARITQSMRSAALLGLYFAHADEGQTLALMIHRSISGERGEFDLTAGAVRQLLAGAEAFFAQQPEPAEAMA